MNARSKRLGPTASLRQVQMLVAASVARAPREDLPPREPRGAEQDPG